MGTAAASLLQGQGSNSAATHVARLPTEVLKRRVGQRRQMQAVQAVSYSLITLVLLVYCYAGTISMMIPSAYFLVGVGLVSIFVVLSESGFNDSVRGSLPHDLPGWRPCRDPALLSFWRHPKSALRSSASCS